MTGLLMLADAGRFWEIAAPADVAGRLGPDLASTSSGRSPRPKGRSPAGASDWRSSSRGTCSWRRGCSWCWGPRLPATGSTGRSSSRSTSVGSLGPPAIVAERWGQFLALALVLAGSLRLLLLRHRGAARGPVRLPGGVHAAVGRNAGDRVGCRQGDRRSGHHRLGPDGLGRQSRSSPSCSAAGRAASRAAPSPTDWPPRPCRWCGPASRWACSSARCPCCSGWSCTCGPPTSRSNELWHLPGRRAVRRHVGSTWWQCS